MSVAEAIRVAKARAFVNGLCGYVPHAIFDVWAYPVPGSNKTKFEVSITARNK